MSAATSDVTMVGSAVANLTNGIYLTSVSCPTSTFCTAVDSDGNALIGRS